MRTLVTSDTHGSYKGLVQALDKAKFDPTSDRLIHLGDVSDGWPETKQCVQLLLDVNAVAIKGNHDIWTAKWMTSFGVWNQPLWTTQGGQATIDSYDTVPDSHREFFKNQLWFFKDEDSNRLFVHAGWEIGWYDDVSDQVGTRDEEDIVWTHSFWRRAKTLHMTKSYIKETFTDYDEVFIGHVQNENGPLFCCGVWNVDTGAGWNGCVSVMDVDTKEVWQSDNSFELYPGVKGR